MEKCGGQKAARFKVLKGKRKKATKKTKPY